LERCREIHPEPKTGEEHLSRNDSCGERYTSHSPRRYKLVDLLVCERVAKRLGRRGVLKDSTFYLKGRNDQAKESSETQMTGCGEAVDNILDHRVGRTKERSCLGK